MEDTEAERARRLNLMAMLSSGDVEGLEPGRLRELGAYGGAQGVWVDKAHTSPAIGEPDGATVAILHTGRYYPDDLSEDGVIYHEVCEFLVAPSMEYVMFGKPTLASSLKQLGDQLLDNEALKAVMISKDDAGDIVITLVEGVEESHKVKFGRIDRRSRAFIPHTPGHERRNREARHQLSSQ